MAGYDFLGKPTSWPQEVECGQDGCKEMAWLCQDQGAGYCDYECPVHGSFAIQFDDPDEDMYDPEVDWGDYDPMYDPDEDFDE